MCYKYVHIILSHSPVPSSSSASSSPSPPHGLSKGSSLSVEKKDDLLISPNGLFTAGFHKVGDNTYCFAIWYSQPMSDETHTIVWLAKRDQLVNGKNSKLSLLKTGNLVLTDAGQSIWSTDTESTSELQLQLNDNGNLILCEINGEQYLWQSFDSPTNTLLPNQEFTKNAPLVSSKSLTNFSSGFYRLFYDNDNVIRLLYDGPEITSVFWPDPFARPWDVGRSSYNNTRLALLDSVGQFYSTDNLGFSTSDFGQSLHRRLTVDVDGNVRVYSLVEKQGKRNWVVSWQAIPKSCKIHGICGQNSLCTYSPESGRSCSCIYGYKMKNPTDWSYGCELESEQTCKQEEYDFIKIPHAEFFGFDLKYLQNCTYESCKKECLEECGCKGFQFKYDITKGYFLCYIKNILSNGYIDLGFPDPIYIKTAKHLVSSYDQKNLLQVSNFDCPKVVIRLERSYEKKHESGSVRFMLWFSSIFGGIEFILIAFFLYITRKPAGTTGQGYLPVATGFKRFTYAELKKASNNFTKEIGRGGGGVVYKGVLDDNRIAAIKKLKDANQGEGEFLAEISTIGRLNHMNLIETWGFCAEGKHRLLVYEYMENGSLAEKLHSGELDWEKRFEIASGTAKGLAYLHEECLEWVLHCDVKPHNILLDVNYNPKVADFGLSKLFDRGGINNSSFSRIRGTRGYMAPEWLFNLPITSKVDVYSYGVVVLEMITGRSPTGVTTSNDTGGMEQKRLVSWMKQKIDGDLESGSGNWIEEIVCPTMSGKYDVETMKNLIKVALLCTDEDKDARPSMSQVVHMLVDPQSDVDY